MRRKNNKSIWLMTVIFFMVLFFAFAGMDLRMKSSVLTLAQAKAQLQVIEIINTVIKEKIAEEARYQEMFEIHKDNDGSIALIQANTNYLNRITTQTSLEIAEQLKQIENVVDIPLGQLTGSRILAAYGPKFRVKIIPAGKIEVNLENEFREAGINQTQHLINFVVKCNVKIAVPYLEQEFEAVAEVPLTETIIVGKVPNTYLKMNENISKVLPGLLEK